MNETIQKWISAGKIIAEDKNAKVKCPVCEFGTLLIRDEPIKGSKKFDRYMICENCGAWNVLTMSGG